MNQEQENFDALRRLLALKRHEVPPPGYFDHLPRRISTRLHANEGSLSRWESLVEWFRLNASVTYSFSLTACGVLAVSIICSARSDTARTASQSRDLAVSWIGRSGEALSSDAAASAHREYHTARWMGSTNPASAAYELPSLFARPTQTTLPTAYEAFSN